jgi:hypothetical protein
MNRKPKTSPVRLCCYANFLILIGIALFFGIYPAAWVLWYLPDPALRGPGMPKSAVALHQRLSPQLAAWAADRRVSGVAGELSQQDISGTEWPLFGSVFYLWSTQALQEAWERGEVDLKIAPRVYARDAIDASLALVLDSQHAVWVKEHWGPGYLEEENCFYRALLVSAITAHHHLTGDESHLPLLRQIVDDLAADIDASPHGLIDDYPGESYPTDVLMAVASIRRADAALGTDHRAFADRAYRAFSGERLDPLGLPPYRSFPKTGASLVDARGCGIGFMCVESLPLYPEASRAWYGKFVEHFWQRRATAAGFREFPKGTPGVDWYIDVDAGPSIAGHGFAATSTGLAAARAHGSFAEAFPLAAELLVMAWPLPNGRLGLPSLLSDNANAPYLGESLVLYLITRTPADGVVVTPPGSLPPLVYLLLAAYVLCGLGIILLATLRVRGQHRMVFPWPNAQAAVWLVLVLLAFATYLFGHGLPALVPVLLGQLVPVSVKQREGAPRRTSVPASRTLPTRP